MSFLQRQNAGSVWLGLIVWISAVHCCCAQDFPGESPTSEDPQNTSPILQPLHLAPPDRQERSRSHSSNAPVEVNYQLASRFEDDGESVLFMRSCQVTQGSLVITAPYAVLWNLPAPEGTSPRVLIDFSGSPEQQVLRVDGVRRDQSANLLMEFSSSFEIRLPDQGVSDVSEQQSPVYQQAKLRRQRARSDLLQTQFVVQQPAASPALAVPGTIPVFASTPTLRRHVTIGQRFLGGDPLSINAQPSPHKTVPPEFLITVTGGVNIVVDNVPLEVDGRMVLTRVDLSADRAVVWTDDTRLADLGSFDIDENTPFQVYLEGNIIVRQGTSEVRASHAFYDLNQRRGLLINAEVRTFVDELDATLRLRAAEVRQHSETSFHAKDAWFTTSQFGHPKWRLQASDIYLEQRTDPYSARIDPQTGERDTSMFWVTSTNTKLFVEDIPVLAVPYLSGPASNPNTPVKRFDVGYSGMFGVQLDTQWNLEGLLGVTLPAEVDWNLDVDYYSKRGPGIGTSGNYDLFTNILGAPAHVSGLGDAFYLYDEGADNLGLGRRNLAPPDQNRGRLFWRNRIDLPYDTWLIGEVGYIFNQHDRNFLEQYYEPQWDTDKDFESGVTLGQSVDNVTGTVQLGGFANEFENQSQWLPKADLTVLGEPLFGSPLAWSSHTSLGYGNLVPATPPVDPLADPFVPLNNPATALPYITDSNGVVAMTRHELSMPFHLGPVNVVPYALGEVAYWQEDVTQNDLARLYGSAGVRASIQFSKYMPQIQDPILGLNGLAHKVTFDLDYYYAQASESLSQIPQYNSLDENAQERFRERYIPLEFGGALPLMFDPRNYALRSGAGRDVTAPYHELVDDQQALWLGMHHRWQTKVGPVDRPRIIDWAELSVRAGYFPDANRDNFGQDFGLISSNFIWHVGPRTSLLASGVFDFFDAGQRVWNVGALSQRSSRGSVYLGYRQVDVGPVNSQLITSSFSYVMSPDLYVATFGSSFDIAEGIDRGESLTITRIGEYFLLHFALGYDRSRDNVGVALSLEPKFGAFGSGSMQLNSLLGIQ